MAVPNTTTFSLQDVVTEINPTTDDLVDCIADANSSGYNSSYYSSPATSLLEFRDYETPTGITSFSSSTGNSNQTTACGLNPTQTYYHDGTGSTPAVGDNVYSNLAGTIGLSKNHYNAGPLAGTFHIKKGGTEVDSISLCAF